VLAALAAEEPSKHGPSPGGGDCARAAFGEDGPDAFAVREFAGTARIGQVRAATQLTDDRRLTQLFPRTLAVAS
jgi:hypothetical protein